MIEDGKFFPSEEPKEAGAFAEDKQFFDVNAEKSMTAEEYSEQTLAEDEESESEK